MNNKKSAWSRLLSRNDNYTPPVAETDDILSKIDMSVRTRAQKKLPPEVRQRAMTEHPDIHYNSAPLNAQQQHYEAPPPMTLKQQDPIQAYRNSKLQANFPQRLNHHETQSQVPPYAKESNDQLINPQPLAGATNVTFNPVAIQQNEKLFYDNIYAQTPPNTPVHTKKSHISSVISDKELSPPLPVKSLVSESPPLPPKIIPKSPISKPVEALSINSPTVMNKGLAPTEVINIQSGISFNKVSAQESLQNNEEVGPNIAQNISTVALLKKSKDIVNHVGMCGLKEGKFSDITLVIGDKSYRLHRLLLTRLPFFDKLFKDNAGETIKISLEDQNVTQMSIDCLIEWIYGKKLTIIGEGKTEFLENEIRFDSRDVIGLLCTSYYFQVEDLVFLCKSFILCIDLAPRSHRILSSDQFPGTAEFTSAEAICRYVNFVEEYEYADITESIEDALLNYLCIDGYCHLEDVFVKLPASWLSRVLEADSFWCPSEFSRYAFVKNIVLRRRNEKLVNNEEPELEKTYSEIFRYAIIYSHMTFEQMNQVRADGLVPEAILMKSLWSQTNFKSEIENSSEDRIAFEENIEDPWSMRAKENGSEVSLASPIRVGVEFTNFIDLKENERCYSKTFFYGGSWWTVFLQKFATVEETTSKPQYKWGIFLRRSEGLSMHKLAHTDKSNAKSDQGQYRPETIKDPLSGEDIERSISYFTDRRTNVRVVFKLYNPSVKSYDAVFESKSNDYAETQSWGYRSRENVVTERDILVAEKEESQSKVRLTLVMKYL